MKQNDVRIGNFVKIQDTNLNVRVLGIGVMGDFFYYKDVRGNMIGVRFDNCSGIPLTERVLEQMGFTSESVIEGYVAYGSPFNLFILRKPTPEDKYYIWEYTEGGLQHTKYVYYAHDIQNLYFLLWGVELEFNDFQTEKQ